MVPRPALLCIFVPEQGEVSRSASDKANTCERWTTDQPTWNWWPFLLDTEQATAPLPQALRCVEAFRVITIGTAAEGSLWFAYQIAWSESSTSSFEIPNVLRKSVRPTFTLNVRT